MTGHTEAARSHRAEAAAVVDGLSDDELSLRPDAAAWLAAVELYLDLYAEADAHASRALPARSRDWARGSPVPPVRDPAPDLVRARQAGRGRRTPGRRHRGRALARDTHRLSPGTSSTAPSSQLAVGDLEIALATAEEAVELTRDLDDGFVTAWAAVRLAGVLLETGQPDRAVELLLGRAGGEELTLIPGGWRAYCLELLTRCWLALGPRQRGRARSRFCRGHGRGRAASPRYRLGRPRRRRCSSALGGDRPRYRARTRFGRCRSQLGAPIEARCRARSRAERSPKPVREIGPWHELQRAAAVLRRVRRAALPRQRGTGTRKARPPPPPAHARGQHRRDAHRIANRTRAPGCTARRRPQDQSRDRRRAVPQPEDGRDPPAQHLPQDRRLDHASSSHVPSSTPTLAPAQPHVSRAPPGSPTAQGRLIEKSGCGIRVAPRCRSGAARASCAQPMTRERTRLSARDTEGGEHDV